MYSKWIKSGFILAMLLISMVSLSMAACPWFIKNELYTAQCGVEKVVPASAGLLANDPGATAVLNPADIKIDPKYGILHVKADGSFVYNPNPDMTSGTYVQFKYNATNGACAAKYAGLAKIQVSCKCRPNVKDITLCWTPATTLEQIKQKIIDSGVDCIGCGAAPTVLDLSQIKLAPGKYTYLLKCPGCQDAKGSVTLVPGCAAVAPPLEFCAGSVTMATLPGMIQAACVGAGCGLPMIDYGNVTYNLIPEDPANGFVSGGYYVAICNPGTECGSWARGDINVIQKCSVTAPNLTICEGKTLAQVVALIDAECASDCDEGPELDTSKITVDATGNVTGGSYTACCITTGITGIECESCASGSITVVPRCIVTVQGVQVACVTPEELEANITIANPSPCGTCDSTPEFDFIDWPTVNDGVHVDEGIYEFTVICDAGPEDCESEGIGVAFVEGCQILCPCEATAEPITVCLGEVKIPALKAMILDDGYTECIDTSGTGLCDIEATIDTTGVTVDANGFVTGGSYMAICKPTDDCLAVNATATVTAVPCCKCKAVAPTIEVCPNKVKIPELLGMIAKEAACDDLPGAVCTAIPQTDTTGVTVDANGYVTGGTYTVTCPSDVSSCTDVTTGIVTVVDGPECHPCDCTATAPNVCIEIVYSDSTGYHQYTYDEVLAAVKKQGGKCDGSCSEMSLKFFHWYNEIGYDDLKWSYEADYQYKVVCENSDGTCAAQSGFGNLDVRYNCNC